MRITALTFSIDGRIATGEKGKKAIGDWPCKYRERSIGDVSWNETIDKCRRDYHLSYTIILR